jgi:O-antigen/teichoic acid export membrane protein
VLDKIKKIEILKVTFGVGFATLFKIFSNFIITKIIAIFTGTNGIALSSQISNFLNISQVISTGGITTGITKYISGNLNDKKTKTKYLNTGFTFISICSIFIAIILVLFSTHLSIYVFNTKKYINVFIIIGLFIPLYSYNSFILSYLNGLKNYKLYSFITILNSAIGTIITFLFVYLDDLRGALISIGLSQSASGIFTILIINSKTELNAFKFNLKSLKKNELLPLLSFSSFTLINLCAIPLSQLLIRNSIIKKFSLQDAGIWDGMIKISFGLIFLLNSIMSSYLIPKISGLYNAKVIKKEIIAFIKIATLTMLIVFIMVFTFRILIIKLLFNQEFIQMEKYFSLQLIGDFFRILGWLIANTLLAKSKIKSMIILEIIFSFLLYITLSVVLSNIFGIKGYYFAYALNYIIYFLIMIIYFNHPSYGK